MLEQAEEFNDLAWLKLGILWRSTDFALHYYLSPQHPQFFGNTRALCRAVRRESQNGSRSERQKRTKELQDVEQNYYITQDTQTPKIILSGERRFLNALCELEESKLASLLLDMGGCVCRDLGEEYDFWLKEHGFQENPQFTEENDEPLFLPVNLSEVLSELIQGKARHATAESWASDAWALFFPEEPLSGYSQVCLHYADLAERIVMFSGNAF
ncbi:hypothetical protein [Acidithiobacillus thiooxidans]|uniref:Uncharacterized protein n=1 Tax=Acidithiobacillus thiooxidans TaxID=930 RepID=A0A1C2JE97_ACITH|nr:hypothetical protein [Acidithiobacillus thiooxidans]OCX70742.1 hypothetical protein A6M23_13505 [Acidithiobacillus thiooxidans]OCX86582.1 hypothetical protein A6P08_05710 [Acidithiobacillus thiooxidans]